MSSIYDVVIENELVIVWKRGSRTVWVDGFESLDELLPNRRLVEGLKDDDAQVLRVYFEDVEFVSSRIEAIRSDVDPIAALARIGKKPGDWIDFAHGDGRTALAA